MRSTTNEETSEGSDVVWTHEVKLDEAVTFRTGRRGASMVAEWPGLATLACAPDGTRARLAPARSASPGAIEKLRRGQVRALLRDLSGGLALHASGVALGRQAVLFVGPSGVGKSTAAAEMCLHQQALLLADDIALVDAGEANVRVLPCEEDHWLDSEACRALGISPRRGRSSWNKRKLRAGGVAVEAATLALVVMLRFDASLGKPAVRRVRGGDAARSLLEAAIRFDVEDRLARTRELEQVTNVYAQARVIELARPMSPQGGVAEFVTSALQGSVR
ncbi:MAG: hypothetical protein M3O50_08505 [Myxococcota bacterium]|nr:hypothetical protein [Myxococcota bacterium]